MPFDRRNLIKSMALGVAATTLGAPLAASAAPFMPALGARSRVLFVNDLAGDIDGLFALVHAALPRRSTCAASSPRAPASPANWPTKCSA